MREKEERGEEEGALLHFIASLLHPVLIDTEALKKMSAWAESVCVCLHVCRHIH